MTQTHVQPYLGELLLPNLPDPLIAEAYEQAIRRNVLPALDPRIFFGYFSVCADHRGHGANTTYPGLDWGQSCDALLWLGRTAEVLASWNYVRAFQRGDGLVPFAILPDYAGKTLDASAGCKLTVESNGAVFLHWVPNNPLGVLANVTFLRAAEAIYRHTQDSAWLAAQSPWLKKAASWLMTQVSGEGLVHGAGFYVERPARIEHDGISQCCTVEAMEGAAELFDRMAQAADAELCRATARRIRDAFSRHFWAGDHFAEYIHPTRGVISSHGYTDVDWAAIAAGMADDSQISSVWPAIRRNPDFIYDGIPSGIATEPQTYEDWEMQNIDRHDLAAMGRVWFLEAAARSRMDDAEGLLRSLELVAEKGRANGWHWRERYYSHKTGCLDVSHIQAYVEYAANLIRIVQRDVMGVALDMDGGLSLSPCATQPWWERGFGQTLSWAGREITYRFHRDGLTGTYRGSEPLRLRARRGRGEAWRCLNLPAQAGSPGREFHIQTLSRNGR
ncbi:MAG: hypothetical protein IT440_03980 [Phycisphaeraceae bacterium]|nr:hypothetical protein [Phycisphaeraceae bacterium]